MAFFLPVFFCEIHQKLLKSRSVCNCRRRRTNDLAISIFQFGGASGSPKCDASVMPGAPIFRFWNLLTCSSILGPVANPWIGSWISGTLQLQALGPSFDVPQFLQPSVQILEVASWAMKLNLADSSAQCRWSGIGVRSRITTRPGPKLGNWLGRQPRH